MKLFFGGAEVPGWRKLLAEERVPTVSLSFVGLSRRVKHLDAWPLADKFPADPGFRQELFLDSGAYSLNKDEGKYSDEEAVELWGRYLEFVRANLDRIDVFSEFDARQLGYRGDLREKLHDLSPDKFMPIWHVDDGVAELEALAERFGRVGILQAEADAASVDHSAVLRRLAEKTRLHGVAMTRMASMKALPWESVGSTSWLSPGQYGDTFVWVGGELKRYPVKYRDQARKRHRVLFSDNGFDSVAIARDATDAGTSEDRSEVLRLSLWSWGEFVEDINRRRETGDVVTIPGMPDDADFGEPGSASVDNPRGRARNGELIPTARDKILLPVLHMALEPVKGQGEDQVTESRLGFSGSNLMRCNSCFAKDKCPAMQADAECAFEIPMQLTTTTQVQALRKWVLSEQGKRVARMVMFEQLEGGYADPNLSSEIRVLQKMLNDQADTERDRASVKIEVTSDGNSGLISRMFGPETERRVNALPEPVDPALMIEDAGIFDAEVVEGNEG